MSKPEWSQGTFTPENPKKCMNQDTIEYRSSWEARFCSYLDQNPAVIKWGYELIKIPYRFDIDGKVHNYTPDFYFEVNDASGTLKKYIVEIKPKHQVEKPVMPKKKSEKSMKNYMYEANAYVKNQNKWTYAERYCKSNGFIFKILSKDKLF
jgi:hypothetical protein